MELRELIEALGGPSEVAARLKLTPSAITNWVGRKAIPGQHHIAVWALAVEKGVAWEPPGIPAPAAKPEAA